jgi:transposase InsO family protein
MSKYSNIEEKEKAQNLALFRHGIISHVLHEGEESQNQFFKRMAEKEHFIQGVGLKKFSVSTFKSWLSSYREDGYKGIKPRIRVDKGSSRKIDGDFTELIAKLLQEMPITTYTLLYRQLIEKGYMRPGDFTLQTLIKFLKDNNISLCKREVIPRKKFETEHVNNLWVCDFMHSIKLSDGKKKKFTYLCAIIDDHTRVITASTWSFEQNLSVLEQTFKDAILSYGKPQKFYCDNARVFTSEAVHLPCAKLGIALIHSKPYDPSSRGKIERFFRTVQSAFIPTVKNLNLSISELNSTFQEWIRTQYHRNIHQGISEPPIDRLLKELNSVKIERIPKETLDLTFYRTIKRFVKLDCTVSVDGKLYEAPPKYIGLQVELRYPSSSPQEIYIFEQDKPAHKLKTLNLQQNANKPFVSLSYSNLF